MSNLSGLPPSAIARAASIANTQAIAVRIINLPDGLQNNPQPVRLSGVVRGQTPDGQLRVETERGVITILLKDRGGLPQGQSIEIEIPAGRQPQQASIRPQALPVPDAPPLTDPQIPAEGPALPVNPAVKFDRDPPIKAFDLAEALLSIPAATEKPPAAPLQAGQILRLAPASFPLPLTALEADSIGILKPAELFNVILQAIGQAVELPVETRQSLLQILSKIDLSSLVPLTAENNGALSIKELTAVFQKLVQTLELPENFKLQNAAFQNAGSAGISAARPLDVKILAFQNGNFASLLSNLPDNPAKSVVNLSQFIVLPQPVAQPENGLPVSPPVVPLTVNAVQQGEITEPLQTPDIIPSSLPVSVPVPGAVQLPALPPSQTPPSFLGQVVGFTPSGQPVLSLTLPGSAQPLNFIAQFVPDNIVVGAPVIVSPLLATAQPAAASLVSFQIGADQDLGDWVKPELWTALQNLIGTVAHLNPAMGQAMIQALPHAGQAQNLGPLGLLFLTMLRGGEFSEWVGEPALNLLRQNAKIDVLRSLAGEAAMAGKLEAAVLPGDWRAAIFPFWHDNQVNKLPLFYKNAGEEENNGDREERRKKLRFMFELKLSRMGPVQVDGFMQRQKLDMILRTKMAVSTNMQEALRRTYHLAMERSNLSGEIAFQFKPEQWVSMEIPATA